MLDNKKIPALGFELDKELIWYFYMDPGDFGFVLNPKHNNLDINPATLKHLV